MPSETENMNREQLREWFRDLQSGIREEDDGPVVIGDEAQFVPEMGDAEFEPRIVQYEGIDVVDDWQNRHEGTKSSYPLKVDNWQEKIENGD